MRLLIGLLLGLVLVLPASAQIKVEASYPAYTVFPIDCSTPEGHDFRSFHWTFVPAKISAIECENGVLHVTGVPGTKYRVICDAISGKVGTDGTATVKKEDHKTYTAEFVIEGDNDDPQPGPIDDDDEPTPPPVLAEIANVLVVEETASRTVEHVKVINDVQFWSSVVARGMQWRLYETDSTDLPANIKDAAQRVGLPAVVMVDKANKVLSSIKLPKTSAEINVEIKRISGK